MASFSWGIVKLWYLFDDRSELQDPQSQQWTFGQVIQMISLAAPLIMVLEEWTIGHSYPSHLRPQEAAI
jgi:hypothetical protein